jgi:hypothetical protein
MMTAMVLAILAPVFAGAEPLPVPREFVKFEAYEGNPVFTGRGPGHWDALIRERGWILREADGYHLWYTGYDPKQPEKMSLGYATSPDGIAWTRHAENPIYDEGWIEDIMIVPLDGTYYMFAEGRGDRAYLLTSTDKIHWTAKGTLDIRLANGEPLTPGPFGTPTAYHEAGTWYLFYERDDEAIWLAKSTDMKTWTNVQDAPVIERGPDAYDQAMLALDQIVKHEGRYYAWYHGLIPESSPQEWTSAISVSEDLVHWQKYSGNPVLRDDQSSPVLVHDGERYRLYTMHPEVHLHLPKAGE